MWSSPCLSQTSFNPLMPRDLLERPTLVLLKISPAVFMNWRNIWTRCDLLINISWNNFWKLVLFKRFHWDVRWFWALQAWKGEEEIVASFRAPLDIRIKPLKILTSLANSMNTIISKTDSSSAQKMTLPACSSATLPHWCQSAWKWTGLERKHNLCPYEYPAIERKRFT